MAVRTLTYMDLTPAQRQKGASRMREKLRSVLNHPFITPDQNMAIFDKIAMVDRWERLEIEVQPAVQMPALPTHHTVNVVEDVPGHEDVS